VSVIAMFSDKGSPGVTTFALALAATWPRAVTIAECDPAGGDLALRLTDAGGRPRLPADSGLLALAGAVRRTASPDLDDHAYAIDGWPNISVLTGLTTPEQGTGIGELWPAIAAALTGPGQGDLIADLGRLHPGSPAHSVAAAADIVVGVARGDAVGVLRLRDRLRHLLHVLPEGLSEVVSENERAPRRIVVVLVVDDRRGAEAVSSMRAVLAHARIPATVIGYLAHDARAVEELHHGQAGPRLERSLLLRSARSLATELVTELTGDQSGPGDPTTVARVAAPSVPRRRGLADLVRSR
jgi:hypothetical protein